MLNRSIKSVLNFCLSFLKGGAKNNTSNSALANKAIKNILSLESSAVLNIIHKRDI